MTLLDQLLDHSEAMDTAPLPPAAREAATVFLTDSVSVALAGSRHPRLPQVQAAAAAWGAGAQARDWASGQPWPAPTAALLNAWQIHNQEFDCVHERAVVHPLATILPALVAVAQREQASGAALLKALVLAVDVAATLGCAQGAPMRFFRPAMCGAMGAALGLAQLTGCSRAQRADALGIAYSQLAGTMQAHLEGSPMLAMQVGLAARAAVTALDLARAGFSGPHDVLEGPFGYFELFDAPLAPRRAQVAAEFARLPFGSDPAQVGPHRIAEVSHKPFPTGRAAHGALDGLATLLDAEPGITADAVQQVELAAPPLILRLVGRPWRADMDVNYARLCLPYLVATWLLERRVTLAHFRPEALRRPACAELAMRVSWRPNDCADPNALAPQTLTLRLRDGSHRHIELPAVLGHPQRPLSPGAQRAKFDQCCNFAGLDAAAAARLHQACGQLHDAPNLDAWLAAIRVPASTPP
ncbi:MAG: MmgE/PrpD family protein [Rubrivivax sp.]|nr:MmgE/PrpD family protein [Rubrivivax sp.]